MGVLNEHEAPTKTDYVKNQEKKPRKKLILPPILPWEYGSNKFASQKGTAGFGSLRNATVSIKSSKELSESNDGVVPRFGCPPLWDKELGSQAGLIPFGGIREHALKIQDKDGEQKKDIHRLANKESESFLKLWAQPNPDAKLAKPFGHKRNEVTESIGGRRFSALEMQASRAAIPRFQDPRNTIAARAAKEARKKDSTGGLIIPPPFAHLAVQQSRIYSKLNSQMSSSNGGCSSNDNEGNELTAEQYMAWLGGQLTIQSRNPNTQQQKARSYASFYDRLMSERVPTKRELCEKLKKLELEKQEAEYESSHDDQSSNSLVEKNSVTKQMVNDESQGHFESENQTVQNSAYKKLQMIEKEQKNLQDKNSLENKIQNNLTTKQTNIITAAAK